MVPQGQRNYFVEHETENYIRGLAGLAPVEPNGPVRLITKKQLAAKLNVSTRTIDRRVAEVRTLWSHILSHIGTQMVIVALV